MIRAALALALALGAGSAAAQDPAVPLFVEEAAAAGIAHVYQGDWEYTVGGGAAVLDCDGDGDDDLVLAGGAAPAALFRNRATPGGALAFDRIPGSGVEVEAVLGIWPLDVDGDGTGDLILTRQGENLALRGLGDCRFARANEDWGFEGGTAWSAALAATWETGAGWPTLAVGNYIDRAEEAFPWGSCTDNWLHRPEPGQRRFAPPQALVPSHCALSMLFTDWARNGTPDLRIANDREYYKGGQEQLWHLPPDGPPRPYTPEEGWARLRIWGMGIAGHDVSGDGRPDYFLTSMADNKLQVLADDSGRPAYADVAFARGVTAHRPYAGDDWRPSTAWHAEWGDVNNDGAFDLYVVKGNVAQMPDFAAQDPNNLLLQRADGRFAEAGDRAGIASMEVGRGGAMADFNRDGFIDLVAVNRWAPASLWRNTGNAGGGAVALRLSQPGPNRDAIGAFVELRLGERVVTREVTVGGGHGGGRLGWLHFGLGAAAGAEVRVIWPGGATGPWWPVAPGGRYRATPEGLTPTP
jgi:hypothetical protein